VSADTSLSLSPDGRLVATAGGGRLEIVKVRSGDVVRQLHVDLAEDVAWSRSGLWLLFDRESGRGVVRVRPDGTDSHLILGGDGGGVDHPFYRWSTWSSNSRHVLTVVNAESHPTRLVAARAFGQHPVARRVPGSVAHRGAETVGPALWFGFR